MICTVPNITMVIRSRMRLAGNVACMRERSAYRVSVGKPEGKRRFGKPRRRGKMILK